MDRSWRHWFTNQTWLTSSSTMGLHHQRQQGGGGHQGDHGHDVKTSQNLPQHQMRNNCLQDERSWFVHGGISLLSRHS